MNFSPKASRVFSISETRIPGESPRFEIPVPEGAFRFCGKPTLRAEFPDQYEAWMKCSSCGFFMGMSNADWHRMKNSPNIEQKIKKMALKKELLKPWP